jgi:hypothetical protein
MVTIINMKIPNTLSAGIGEAMFETKAMAVVTVVMNVDFMARA